MYASVHGASFVILHFPMFLVWSVSVCGNLPALLGVSSNQCFVISVSSDEICHWRRNDEKGPRRCVQPAGVC